MGVVKITSKVSPLGKADTLLVGVVGMGVMGSNHARVLSDLSAATLVGVVDPDESRRNCVAQNLQCMGFRSIDQLIRHGVDAIVIAAPTSLHRDLALECISAGVHVLVEKPIASSLEDGRTIVEAAHQAKVTLMAGHVERFNPAVESLKLALKNEQICSIAITRVGPFPPQTSGISVVTDLAVHDIDLIRWLTDSEIVEIQPLVASARAEREDIALLQFRTSSGVLACINTNWVTPFKARTIQIATRDKYLTADLQTAQVTEWFGFQRDGSYSMRHLAVGYVEPLRAELVAFLDAIRNCTPPPVSGEEGLVSLEIAIHCLNAG